MTIKRKSKMETLDGKIIEYIHLTEEENQKLCDVIIENFLNIDVAEDVENTFLFFGGFEIDGTWFNGLGSLFNIAGIEEAYNDYFARKKIGLKAVKSVYKDDGGVTYLIRFEKFTRMDHVSKSEVKDDIGRDIIEGDKYNEIFRK